MIRVSVNGRLEQIEESSNLVDLLTQWGYECGKVAVAINADFVPRSQYASVQLNEADRVDIVAPVQGG